MVSIRDQHPIRRLESLLKHFPTNQLTVCVTGAAGQIAYSLIPALCRGEIFGANYVHLRLLDIPQALEVLNGTVMEVNDGAYPLILSIQAGTDPKVLFKNCDVIIFLGGFPRKAGMERKDLLERNCSIFKEQGLALKEVGKVTTKCLVVANPANTNCTALQYFSQLPPKNFTALTRLDSNRMTHQVANHLNLPSQQVKKAVIWGNHSSTQVPDTNFLETPEGKKITVDAQWALKTMVPKVRQRGAEIIKVKKGSSVFSAANGAIDHLRDWYFGSDFTIFSVMTDGKHYGIPKGLCFSYPVKTNNFDWEIIDGLEIKPEIQREIDLTVKELLEERKEALGF